MYLMDEATARVRREELLREAENERLARLAREQTGKTRDRSKLVGNLSGYVRGLVARAGIPGGMPGR